jgi:hypothetical protein
VFHIVWLIQFVLRTDQVRYLLCFRDIVLLSALPYMAQIIVYGNINHYAYVCVQDELHRTIRFQQVFDQDNHLTAMANDSPTSPEGNLLISF